MSGQIDVAVRLGFFRGILIDIVSLEVLSLFVYRRIGTCHFGPPI